MRLLFIHGIGQEDFTEPKLLVKWCRILTDHGFDSQKLAAANPEMAFYGDVLGRLSAHHGAAQPMGASAAEVAGASRDEQEFLAEALAEIADARGISRNQAEAAAQRAEQEIGAELVTPMSTVLGRFGVGVLRFLEDFSPTMGEVALRVLKQAYAYLKTPGVGPQIDALVRPRIGTGEVVVVAHSLGTIVAFRLLRELARADADVRIPLLITLGSPLAQEAVHRNVGLPWKVPGNVASWENYYDRGDPVTLGRPLSPRYAGGIADFGDVNNKAFNAHSIEGYLDQARVHNALAKAL